MNKAEWLASREPLAALEAQWEVARDAYRRQPSQANADRCELLWEAVKLQKEGSMLSGVDCLRAHAADDRATADIQKTWEKQDPRARETKNALLLRAGELEGAARKLEKLGKIAQAIVTENEDGHTLSLTMCRFADSMRQDAADQRDYSLVFYADRIEAWADYIEKLESHAREALA